MLYSVNDTRLFVREQGPGEPTLVFLHFYGDSSRTWQPVTDQLPARYRCLAHDHRGWGQLDRTAAGYGIPELAADATALLAQPGLSRYVLVAQLLVSQQPTGLQETVSALVPPLGCGNSSISPPYSALATEAAQVGR